MAVHHLICALLMAITIPSSNSKNVYEGLDDQHFSQFKALVSDDPVLNASLKFWSLTVFAPNNEAFAAKRNGLSGNEMNVALYHIMNLLATESMFPFSSTSLLSAVSPLYMSVKYSDESPPKKELYVNNAKILRSENFLLPSGNRQILYVIDEVLEPMKSKAFPSAFDLLQNPEEHGVPDVLEDFRRKVLQDGSLIELFRRAGTHTFFVPIQTEDGNGRTVDPWIIQGHVIPKVVLFTRVAKEIAYPSEAYGDDIKVELSFLKSNNDIEESSDAVYAQSDTVFSKHGHRKGTVPSKIIKGNLPVSNGVVHFIEHPFMVVDTTVWKFLNQEKQSRLSEFMKLVEKSPEFMELLKSPDEKTIFAPSNDAIRQLDKEAVDLIQADITDFLKLHLVKEAISTGDVVNQKQVTASDNKTSLCVQVYNHTRRVLSVEGGGVKATAIYPDIGALDGVVHIIDKFLSIPIQTVYQMLQSEHDLSFTYKLGESSRWSEHINAVDKNFTFFAPNNGAWEKVKEEMATPYKQLEEGGFGYHASKILDRHLIVGKMITLEELVQMDEIQMIHGNFKVLNSSGVEGNSSSKGGVALEWVGIRARIVHSDLQAVNGIIHVIDTVMMKKRDLTKSDAAGLVGGLPLCVAAVALSIVLRCSTRD